MLLAFLLVASSLSAQRQYSPQELNLANYDDKWLHYGFALGVHGSRLGLRYSEVYDTPQFDSLHSIRPGVSAGFSLGFVLNLRLGQYADLRLQPAVVFYEYRVDYKFVDPNPSDAIAQQEDLSELLEATLLEFPLLLKYKSMRFKNTRAYLIGGFNAALEVTGRNKRDTDQDVLEINNSNVFVEYGFGVDFYFQYFKFSPELRFSHGLIDQTTGDPNNPFNDAIGRLTTNKVSLYLLFE